MTPRSERTGAWLQREPDATPTDLADPTWWDTLFRTLRETQQTIASSSWETVNAWTAWLTWLADDAVGPHGAALSWTTFVAGVDFWTQQTTSSMMREGLQQWLVWHSSGRHYGRRQVRWPDPAPRSWQVWEAAPAEDRDRVVQRVVAWFTHETEPAHTPLLHMTTVVGALPLEPLGLRREDWAPMVRYLTPPGAPRPMVGERTPSPERLATGLWARWLAAVDHVPNPAGRRAAPPAPPATEAERKRHRMHEALLDALASRDDWPDDALTEIWAQRGAGMFRLLTPQRPWPLAQMLGALEQVPPPQILVDPSPALRDVAAILWQAVPPAHAPRLDPPTPAAGALLSRLICTGRDLEDRLWAVAAAGTPVDAPRAHREWIHAITQLGQTPGIGRLVSAPAVGRLLQHPDREVRESGLRMLGDVVSPAESPTPLAPDRARGVAR